MGDKSLNEKVYFEKQSSTFRDTLINDSTDIEKQLGTGTITLSG